LKTLLTQLAEPVLDRVDSSTGPRPVGGTGTAAGHRAVATRYDKLACRYQVTVTIAAINDWL
jgi:hypothetical protein